MKRFILKAFFILMLLSIMTSCKSSPKIESDYMYLMIYDYENNGIKDVSIFLDEKLLGQSDINGRFFIPIVKETENHTIKLQKKGYETITQKIKISANIVLYYKMASSSYYFSEAEKLFDQNDIDGAIKLIDKAIDIEGKDEFLFFKSIILVKSGKTTESSEILKMIKTEIPQHIRNKMEDLYEN